jgi:hypothetical protein
METVTYIDPESLPTSFRMPEKKEGMSETFHAVLVDRAIRKALKHSLNADYGSMGFDAWSR